ncbi:hypothetical protein [uncultured Flavobacterium sp.]|uniref:hypothetical protein n=1 Tax=uncultured Flavobacterium sp. TaxID=165435 RepID=UPI0025DF4B4E|nr:hypothetical protein [uncultured Flavobacterium sp.]
MKEEDKNIEKFIGKVMAETSLETPSFDFTSKIMAQVSVAKQPKAIEYKPLISKPIWYSIFGILTAMIAYSFFSDSKESQFDIDLSAAISSLIPTVHFSDATTYSVLIVTLMVMIQIPLLKNYFDKRFEV